MEASGGEGRGEVGKARTIHRGVFVPGGVKEAIKIVPPGAAMPVVQSTRNAVLVRHGWESMRARHKMKCACVRPSEARAVLADEPRVSRDEERLSMGVALAGAGVLDPVVAVHELLLAQRDEFAVLDRVEPFHRADRSEGPA